MVDLTLHSGTRPVASAPPVVAALTGLLATWRRRARERHELAQLDGRVLRDLGVSASEVAFEASKPFWRA